MHESVRAWLARKAGLGHGKSILEIGSRIINRSPREVFTGAAEYVGIDLIDGPGVDLVTPVESYRPDRTFELVLCIETFEHLADWQRALEAMTSLCSGMLLLTARSPGYGYHPYPEDFWRLTALDARTIFREFGHEVEPDPELPGIFCAVRANPQAELVRVDLKAVEPTTITVVIPAFRSTASQAIESVTSQARPGDRVMVVGERGCCEPSDRVQWLDDVGAGTWEQVYAKIQRGFDAASTDYVMYLGDDDQLLPGALDTIRRKTAATANAPRAHIFSLLWKSGQHHDFTLMPPDGGHLNPQQVVIPVATQKPRWWHNSQQSDQDWITRVRETWLTERHAEPIARGVQSLGRHY